MGGDSAYNSDVETTDRFDPKIHEGEYKRICKECGKVWHTSYNVEQQLALSTGVDTLQVFGSALTLRTNDGNRTQASRNIDANLIELNKLKSCPNCGSKNYDETFKFFLKKETYNPIALEVTPHRNIGLIITGVGLLVTLIKLNIGLMIMGTGAIITLPEKQFAVFGVREGKYVKLAFLGFILITGVFMILDI